MNANSETLQAADGTPLKKKLQQSLFRNKLRAFVLVSPLLVFLIFLANNIQDPLYDWPLFGNELTNFIKEKYGSVDSARTGVHHYEQIIRSEVNKTADTPKVLEKVVVVNKETYDLLGETKRKIIYNYDYEIIKNNAKKQIVLIEDIYTKQILQELRSLYAS